MHKTEQLQPEQFKCNDSKKEGPEDLQERIATTRYCKEGLDGQMKKKGLSCFVWECSTSSTSLPGYLQHFSFFLTCACVEQVMFYVINCLETIVFSSSLDYDSL